MWGERIGTRNYRDPFAVEMHSVGLFPFAGKVRANGGLLGLEKGQEGIRTTVCIAPGDLALNCVEFSAAGMLAVTPVELRWIGGEST